MSLLPATTYNAPSRLGRGRPLKTISEGEECNFGLKSDSEGDDSDRTIIARPMGLDAKLATASSATSRLSGSSCDATPSPIESSPCSSSSIEDGSQRDYARGSYADSDAGTVFSEESCPSLAGSNDTTFYTNSSRNSTASNQSARSSRNRYPPIFIPRSSWSEENAIKEVALGMSPAQKIMLSPQALSALPQHTPSLNAPPSFGEGSSVASSSPCIPAVSSAPITPELHNFVAVEGGTWGNGNNDELPAGLPLEIAVDEEHSIIVSRREALSQRESTGYSTDWSEMVVRFPNIPGATPQENTPIEPDITDLRSFRPEQSDHGVQLSNDAMKLLANLTRSYSPVSESLKSNTTLGKAEMKERSEAESPPRSAVPQTPTLSDYSFSQLSIPSPGGFFSSLQASSRATWCSPGQSKASSVPSSAVAENFYAVPFRRSEQMIETIMEVPDRELTDGPPTARQQGFEIPAEYRADEEEDDDLYGSHTVRPKKSPGYEYEATYEEELRQAAVAHIDRTGNWLSQQNSYMSALRESNPLNDPAEYIPQTPHPKCDEDQAALDGSPASKAVRFLDDAIKASDTALNENKRLTTTSRAKDSVYLEAFKHCTSQHGRLDAFLHASARLENLNSNRLALPLRHVYSLLNIHTTETLQTHVRPKYRGPFGQNPRATGNFTRTKEQIAFAEAERKQLALDYILPTIWATEAQRKVFHKGGLLACPAAVSRIINSSRKNLRILDLAGAAIGSWAWTTARKWPHVKVVTVQAKAQSQHASRLVKKGSSAAVRPETPPNHKIVTVLELWKLPFGDNHFDVVSARTLYMLLRSRPIPEVPSIDEWDLTLKECMRVLKPGGVLDFIMLDSHISNNSSDNRSKHNRDNSNEASVSPTANAGQALCSPPPTATFGASDALLNPASLNFGRQLKKAGYDADGGCSKITERLAKVGFVNVKRQWIGLPLGRTELPHDNVTASYESFDATATSTAKSQKANTGIQRSKIGSVSQANGRSRTPFPPAPRPISEVSSISRIIEQYSNVEAVHGPVGSTAEVSDMAGLLGTMMWEEWLVRHRLETLNGRNRQFGITEQETTNPTFEAENLLYGINDILAAGYAKGACFRAVIGWARKPNPNKKLTAPAITKKTAIQVDTSVHADSYQARAAQMAQRNPTFSGFPTDATPTTANTASTATPLANQYYGRGFTIQTPIAQTRRDLTLDTTGVNPGSIGSPHYYTESAVERGEVGTIPMMIIE
ncbi:hypothetical protein PMZ80_003330 [Knufia obscura]|uniref:Methyltransferase type 11 domain-containing protein n=1 Tax=Knufia obscura TaxID=1635080 RepID=A0ABR0RVI2_9EURO|nr:hypothetical protein PMZ80_003330 [Knufia obscura]